MAHRQIPPHFRYSAALGLLAVLLWQGLAWSGSDSGPLTDTEFEHLALGLSESPGYFPTDNLLSNETSFLHVVPLIVSSGSPQSAYVGVGPEQNFTYMAHSRPAVAFIVDIRRDARLQHLYYKRLFEDAPNRWEFLSRLLGRPLPSGFEPDPAASGRELVEFFGRLPRSRSYFERCFEELWTGLSGRFPQLATELDRFMLLRISSTFFEEGFQLTYRMGRGRTVRDFPDLEELITETDLAGSEGHFLSDPELYGFLRQLQRDNLVVPVVGNFAGPTALRAVGQYLRDHDLEVSLFYASNVEFYLFRQGDFSRFMANLKTLPFSERGVLVRSFFNFWYGYPRHPEATGNYYVTSLAQRTRSLLRQHERDPYLDYWDLVTRNYLTQPLP